MSKCKQLINIDDDDHDDTECGDEANDGWRWSCVVNVDGWDGMDDKVKVTHEIMK